MSAQLACIVEGQGDLEAVPILLRRIFQELSPGKALQVHPFRIPRTKLLKEGELERAVELAARRAGRGAGVLILLDSDDDCPALLGPRLLARAARTRPDVSVRVVLAHREEWLTARMSGGQHYVETLDQPALAAVLDLAAARRAESFDKLWRDLANLLAPSA